MTNTSELDYKEEYLRLKKEVELKRSRANLPHLYGPKFYRWQRVFWESVNRITLLFCANQTGKSSIQIRKIVRYATDKSLWPKLWPKSPVPRVFWYFYPDIMTANVELETKWIAEWLPRGPMKDDPVYGWELVDKINKSKFPTIRFFSGVTLYFKGYSQDVHSVQSTTVHYIASDEELPVPYFDELMFRLTATDGYFSMVCTATRGQIFWKNSIEPSQKNQETLKGACKIQASMYDCLVYEDGDTNTPFTVSRIKQIEDRCSSEAQKQIRVHGKFAVDNLNLTYGGFKREHNVVSPYPVDGWLTYIGIDIGSGGARHPSCIAVIAVRQDYKKAAVVTGWRGAGELTASSDVVDSLRLVRGKRRPVLQCYDYHARDFFIVASRLGENLVPADKDQERGKFLLNSLFKNRMLDIFDVPELEYLCYELENLSPDTPKNHAVDDFIDSVRYGVTRVPFDFTTFGENLSDKEEEDNRQRRVEVKKKAYLRDRDELLAEIYGQENEGPFSELDEWSELYE